MKLRHFLASLIASCATACQHRPALPPVPSLDATPHSLSPASKQRLAKARVKDAARVVAFAINRKVSRPSPDLTMLINGTPNADRTPPEGVPLNDSQVNAFLDACTVSNYPSTPARCFHPRHGILIYDHKDQQVADMTICFSCLGYRANGIKIVAKPDYKSLAKTYKELGLL